MDLFDIILVFSGAALTLTGVILFARGKLAAQAAKVEAFGIKLDVTNPSLILVLAGVLLMVSPRLLPHAPSEPARPEAAAPTRPGPAAAQPATPPAVTPSVPDKTAQAPAAGAAPTGQEKAVVPSSIPEAAPAPPKAASAEKPVPKTPVAKPRREPASPPAPVQTRPAGAARHPAKPERERASELALAKPEPTPPVAAEKLRAVTVVTQAILTRHGFWERETPESYADRMARAIVRALEPGGQRRFRFTVVREPQLARRILAEPAGNPESRRLCEASRADLLMAARTEASFSISSVESAYWPDLQLRLYDCASGEKLAENTRMSPNIRDSFPFEADLTTSISRFMRENRSILHPRP